MGYVTVMVGADAGSSHKNIVTVRRDRDGQPIRFTNDPILAPDEWHRLQDAINSRARARGVPQARRLLWGVAFCRKCSEECEDELPCAEHDVKLYGYQRVKGRDSKGSYYWCKRCGLNIRKDRLEAWAAYRVRQIGRWPLLEYVTEVGDDFSAEIHRLQRRVERWRMDLDTEYDPGLDQAVRNAEDRIQKLIREGTQSKPERKLVPVEPPTTISEHWASLDDTGRNGWLRETGAWFMADRDGVMTMLGLMDVADKPGTLPKSLRKLKLPDILTWEQIDELLAGERPA
jgi:hypothetical protein